MRNPFSSPSTSDGRDAARDDPHARMAETLQQALRQFGGDKLAPGGQMTPDALAELAQRAGLTAPGQMADLARMMGVGPTGPSAPAVPQHIVFLLGDVECALPAETVQGVERITDIAAVPNTVSWVLGIVHLRGAIVSVVDLRGFFGMPTQPITPRSRLLVVNQREMTVGFVVDGVTEMRPLMEDGRVLAPTTSTPQWALPYAADSVNLEGRVVVLLDPERLLFADKLHRYRADFS